ncbi:7-carboxy-7-deazaguanine synthase [Porticoccaceae bacterium]|jgi:7-carboxy-7-deazaguanine synthase (Cx14CxxC type)|nr:7-carboxy-7-deazaguanine synthase [Porticoccaceae bacterium]MDC0370665.1 7-carboxy-7-deazaguanine synthase [Porticoccaceae bacterium]MDC3199825.1 7-carboxy-7-deazaguanine synthase [Porticoccaceae bacterium]
MAYAVKEIFYSLQGEGAHAGRPAIFCRFTGCNLWSGQEKHRADAVCQFCDTDFVGTDGDGGGSFKNAVALAKAVVSYWPESITDIIHPYVICTGGEPLLQLDKDLIEAFHNEGVEVAIETNGTIPVPEGIDWVCVSPKSGSTVVVEQGDEIKLVYPQEGHQPSDFVHLNFEHFFLQPMFDEDENGHVKETIEYCLTHPRWSLSLQSHKLLGLQ